MAIKHRYLTAFILSILIHLLLLTPLMLLKTIEKPQVQTKKVLNLSQFDTNKKEPTPKPVPVPQKNIQKPTPKPLPQKPTPSPLQKAKQEINITEPIAVSPVPLPSPKVVPIPEKQPSSALSALNDAFKASPKIEPTGQIKKLYGDEFDGMTQAQKEFIKENLSGIGRITEKHLRYPDVAGKLGMQGQSVVEFWLHPSGDISDVKLLDSSGYKVLDKNSIETIEVAYKDYPRPRQKTKIRIYVRYSIY